MKLSRMLQYDTIVIQCHDNPDADAICSGYVLYRYFKKYNKKVRFIYSGDFQIAKSNLVYLIDKLQIPIEYVSSLKKAPDLLVLTDCQYEEGNVTRFHSENIAVIDHHQVSTKLPKLNEVRSNLGSCCSVIWNLLKIEHEEDVIDDHAATALYYGLYSDTHSFSEISHPLDRDMIDSLQYDKSLILKLKNMNLTLKEAKIAGIALLGIDYHKDYGYAILRTDPCDPNILGLIGDFILAIDSIDVCLVYSVLPFGIKFSIRSCTNETRANELAEFIAEKIGSGGGHTEKAGGILKYELLAKEYKHFSQIDDESNKHSTANIISERMSNYFENCDIIYAGKTKMDTKSMKEYVTDSISRGYVYPSKLIPEGNMAIIRTISGDTNYLVKDNSVLVIDGNGEVTTATKSRFNSNYSKIKCSFDPHIDYIPSLKNADTGKTYPLLPTAKSCIYTSALSIYARPLHKTTKVFSAWDNDNYILGKKGDYIAVSKNNPKDIFIIPKKVFKKTYYEQ
ncbi:DHH family phosphoesterase [Butyrivibrio proteoclasticus]|uniref:DHH family phosphoesterase n=1 Tax=Butyrivibrio proteoclasticus TaxID=43305 RepID=UPI00047BB5A7|nr:DHH family phosphoesterase [Butyrivibrio proteoclasticus]